MLFDSHAHLNFKAFADDLENVIENCISKGMGVINVGSQLATSQKAVELAQNYNNFFAAVGIHPIHITDNDFDDTEEQENNNVQTVDEMFEEICQLAGDSSVVAIGETGLDYFRLTGNIAKTKEKQKEFFIRHIRLANSLNKPLILHARGLDDEVYEDILKILKENNSEQKSFKGIIHCFGGSLQIAKKFIDQGFLIGFTGIITFKTKSEKIQNIVKELSLEKILIETDSPYLAPEPYRGQRNEPIYVELVAKKIAELKGIAIEEVISQTAKNAIDVFGL